MSVLYESPTNPVMIRAMKIDPLKVVTLAAAINTCGNVYAADARHLRKLYFLRNCAACDLAGIKLRYEDLKNAVLTKAGLLGADLKAVDLNSATMLLRSATPRLAVPC